MSDNAPGDLLILLAFAFNLLAAIGFLLAARGKRDLVNLARKSYNFFTVITALAVAYLFYLFFTHNYAIKYVYEYSDSSLSFFYLMSAFWAGQEGTYLLWLFLNALFGYIIIRSGNNYRNWAMVVFTSINLFFLLILMKLSPFAMLDHRPADGAGLNPLLQDPWMVIHPPIIFVGYAMAGVPYAIAMAALIVGDFSQWLKKVFPWVAITALMLAAGNILGGYWAYKTLGWGGYWAWDPVENSSFIPWFASLALLHGMIIERRSGALRKTNMLLTSFVFVLVVYGTFLTRSGVLADFSVHSFVDLGINQYLVGFLVFYVLLTLVLFVPRIKKLGHVPLKYNFYNREFIIFSAMVLLFLFSVVVLFWTSLPILSGLFSDEPRAADLATYNDFALPFAIVFSLLLTVSPFLNFNSYIPRNWKRKLTATVLVAAVVGFGLFYFFFDAGLAFAGVFTLVLTGLTMYLFKSDLIRSIAPSIIVFTLVIIASALLNIDSYLYIFFFATAAMAVTANLLSVFSFLPGRWKIMGGQLTHLGFGLMIIGVLASSAFAVDQKLVLPRGDAGQAYGLSVSYNGMQNNISFPKNKLLLSYEEQGEVVDIEPQLYFSERLNGIMRKPYIQRNVLYDLYFSPEQVQELHEHDGLVLTKGERTKLEDYHFTFKGFEMPEHGSGSEMTVVADIDLEYNGNVSNIRPAVAISTGPGGRETTDLPAQFGDDNQYTVSINRIIADQGAVSLIIPGLAESGPPDRLILAITRKPVINLVWIGTTLILLGTLIVFIRRRLEMTA
ncbi:MAG: cytochrome c biogenesis protein CcsA [Candidatus Zixiibacteriota bacterium]|nr:MAG: cytochrome c biogenesis protein CcsA [candidate division Zixibacteria bacterium]